MEKNYYKILGVKPNASSGEIKRSFRKLAKELHPDVNDSQDAHNRFTGVNEAYEILSNLRKKYIYDLRANFTDSPRPHSTAANTQRQYDGWVKDAQSRAAYHSHLGYEAFLKTRFYKTASAVSSIVGLAAFSFGVFLCFIPVVRYYTINQPEALWALLYCVPVGLAFIASGLYNMTN